jgi:hypothetical protein
LAAPAAATGGYRAGLYRLVPGPGVLPTARIDRLIHAPCSSCCRRCWLCVAARVCAGRPRADPTRSDDACVHHSAPFSTLVEALITHDPQQRLAPAGL